MVCLLVWAFGALEYVNYFVVRLSYPLAEWFVLVGRRRRPVLVRDVARAAPASATRAAATSATAETANAVV